MFGIWDCSHVCCTNILCGLPVTIEPGSVWLQVSCTAVTLQVCVAWLLPSRPMQLQVMLGARHINCLGGLILYLHRDSAAYPLYDFAV